MGKYGHVPLLTAFLCGLGFLALMETSDALCCQANPDHKTAANYSPRISWRTPRMRNGETLITGSVQIAPGTFEFHWIIGGEGRIRLVVLEPSGGAEMPPLEKRLLLLVRTDGTTLLFQEWLPLVNVEEPASIRVVANVPTGELFSVLPAESLPPDSTISRKIGSLVWNGIRERHGVKYLQGQAKTPFGALKVIWKKESGHLPELVTLDTPGAGERPAVETRLHLWMDKAAGTTAICREKQPQLDQSIVPHLQGLARVRTAELIAGFRRLLE